MQLLKKNLTLDVTIIKLKNHGSTNKVIGIFSEASDSANIDIINIIPLLRSHAHNFTSNSLILYRHTSQTFSNFTLK